MMFEEFEQPLIVGGISYEKNTYEKMETVLEEYIDGVISYRTKEICESFLKEIKNYITEEIFSEHVKSRKACFYVVMNNDTMEIYMYSEKFIKDMFEFKDYEEKIIKAFISDLS